MKNFKQIAFGLMVGALAIGFSAFTTKNSAGMKIRRDANGKVLSVVASYYRLPAFASNVSDTDPSHYKFSTSPRAGCNAASDICSTEWQTDNAPTNGQSPVAAGSPVFSSDDAGQGIYNGN